MASSLREPASGAAVTLSEMLVEPLPPDSWARDAKVRKIMQGNRPRDTRPETLVRSVLHAAGFRFRKHAKPLRDLRCEADVVFPTERVAIFIDGCYWHGCPVHWRRPRTNTSYWVQQLTVTSPGTGATTTPCARQVGW
jgi:DNA mismatch endonuclease, patch repair protein